MSPSLPIAQGADVRADNGALTRWELIDVPSSRHQPTACQVTLYELKVPGI